jgi:hypothetical protein
LLRDSLRVNTVTCLLKAGIGEPEKTPVTRKRCCKHVSAATEADTTMEELLEKKHARIEEMLEY